MDSSIKKKLILIQKDDFKSRGWAKAARELSLGKLVPISGSAMFMPVVLLNYILTFRKPHAIIFRYLNDYPSLARSLARTFTELSSIIISKLFRIRVYWICHNVDKESTQYFQSLSKFRRRAIIKYSSKVFVTDDLLVKYAEAMLGINNKLIEPLCFGSINYIDKNWDVVDSELKVKSDLISEWCNKNLGNLVGLWIGSPSNKSLIGLSWIANFLKRNDNDIDKNTVRFVIIGPVGEWLRVENKNIYEMLKTNRHALFINDYYKYPISEWSKNFSFVLNPLDDYSIAYTTYNSALAKLPVITVDSPFLGEFVSYYNIGLAISYKTSADDLINAIRTTEYRFDKFLQDKTWKKGVRRIFNA